MPDAALGGDPGHDLIQIPFSVPIKVQLFTIMHLTSSSFGYLPRLPTLCHGHRQWTNYFHSKLQLKRRIYANNFYHSISK